MPIRFGKVSTNHETFLPESIEQVLGDITVFSILIRPFCNAVIRVFRVVHTESIVMLSGEDKVFASGICRNVCPTGRFELDRIE
jgi:hypothetical protein